MGALLAVLLPSEAPFRALFGVGGIGAGIFYALEGEHTLGRNESRPGRLLDVRDYCKLHIIAHYVAVLLGADPSGERFHVLPIGRVGCDQVGERLRQEMAGAGMDLRFILADPERPTILSVCFQYPDGSGGNITPTNAAASALTTEEIDAAEPYLAANRERAIALAAPEVPLAARYHLLELATRHGAFRVAALTTAEVPEAQAMGLLRLVDLLAVNEDEAAALVGRPFDPSSPEPFLAACTGVLLAQQPRMRILLSAGKQGAYAYSSGCWDWCPAATVPVASTAGAGDALLAGVLVGLAAGIPLTVAGRPRVALGDRPLSSALDLGTLLAALSVTSPHTIHPAAHAGSLVALARELGLVFGPPLEGIV